MSGKQITPVIEFTRKNLRAPGADGCHRGMNPISRRTLAQAGTVLLTTNAFAETAPSPIPEQWPVQPSALAIEMVGVSHLNFKRTKELVEAWPTLVNAAIDWGFGDWESALGAASHVGSQDIAEYLIANGARPTLFSAAMLGQLEVVKAMLEAQPGVQKIRGPHSISLLAHARAGGPQAERVLKYLESLGDAGSPPHPPLTAEEKAALEGTWIFGKGAKDRLEVKTNRNGVLTMTHPGNEARNLLHLGSLDFHPAGAPTVRVRFAGQGRDMVLTVHDKDILVTAKRD